MQETRCLCDKCHNPGARTFSYNVGSGVDASGNNASRDLMADLCDKCRFELYGAFHRNEQIESLLRKLPHFQEYLG